MEDNKNYELDCLMRSIKEVEVAKADKPEMYQEALSKLKKEAKAISSIKDLGKAYSKAKSKEEGGEEEDDDS
jgi:hypothetical protein